jgi:hypothetical protein
VIPSISDFKNLPLQDEGIAQGAWKIYIADSNNPAGGYGYKQSVIHINPSDNTYTYDNLTHPHHYSGGAWTGGRMFYYPFHVMSEPPVTPFSLALGLVNNLYSFTIGSTGQTVQVTDSPGRSMYELGLSSAPTRWEQLRRDDAGRIPDLARMPLADGDPTISPEIYVGKGVGSSYRYLVKPRSGVTTGTPYQFTFHSGSLSSDLSIPGTPGVPETIDVDNVGTAGKSVSLTIPAGGEAKEVAWAVSGPLKERWARLDTRTEPFVVHYAATDPAPGSGLALVSAGLDGVAVANGQSVDVLWDALGVHTLTVAAEDAAGLKTTRSTTFSIVATLDSLEGTVRRLDQIGDIKHHGTATSLLAKIHAAQAAVARNCPDEAYHVLDALLHEVRAGTGRLPFTKRITERAVDLLTSDVQFVQAQLPRTCSVR